MGSTCRAIFARLRGAAGLAVLGWLVGSAAAQQASIQPVLDRLGIALPPDVAARKAIADTLDQLRREACDQSAIRDLGKTLDAAGYRREAANALVAFSGQCGDDSNSLRAAANILLKLTDYRRTVEVAGRIIELVPYNDNAYYLRALAYDGLKDHRRAIADYVTAIELFGNKDRIASVGYMRMSDDYAALGEYCEAMRPIGAWVALNPTRNDTSQTRSILATLDRKGNCAANLSGREERITIPNGARQISLVVEINSTRGRFLLDTGATFVSVRRSFARAARMFVREDDVVQLHTANGIARAALGRADTVKVGRIVAKNVSAAVQSDHDGAYGQGIDGLLGMSFLSRFDVRINDRSVTLRVRDPGR